MTRIVTSPPPATLGADGLSPGGWWHDADDGQRIICDLCPRECALKPGDRGFCFVRQNVDGQMQLTTYGRSTGFCIDPIEKKPLNHFYPGTSVLSFGTAGCNLGCKFCQNWDISKSREVERLSELAGPEAIAAAARHYGCRSVAFTYNDPVIWAEYAIDAARACRAVGVKTVAVTAGYISPAARGEFFAAIDAANVDLKGFTEEFYYHTTYSHLQPVLDTLEWLKRETDVWFEITNLVIPQSNDSLDEIRSMCDWILEHIGDDTPVHFTAFHPDFRMRDRPPTPHETLLAAYDAARRVGLKYVYTGNVNDVAHQSTYCPHCGQMVIQRNWYELGEYRLQGDRCAGCGGQVAGHFDAAPGAWGRKRAPVQISQFARQRIAPAVAAPPMAPPTPTPAESSTASPAGPVASSAESPDAPSLVQIPYQDRAMTASAERSSSRDSNATSAEASDASTARSGRPRLSLPQQQAIEQAANRIVAGEILGRRSPLPDPTLAGAASIEVMGAFVTLKRRGRLRACCGFLGQPMTLLDALSNAARRTALEDARLPPISPTELPFLDLDVSLLYGFEPVQARGRQRLAAVEVGRHGLTIRHGNASGLLLPVVPVENGWDVETYLRQVCHKAGLPTTAWESDAAQLTTFEAFCVGGPFQAEGLETNVAPPYSDDDLRQLAAHCQKNLLAMVRGATPDYYLFTVGDGTVSGVAMTVRIGELANQFVQISLRPGVPLQATLFQLCETAAAGLRGARVEPAALSLLRVGVSLMTDPAMHGTAHEPDLRGVATARRSLLLTEGSRSAWVFDPSRTAEELAMAGIELLQTRRRETIGLFSLATRSTEPSVEFTNVPRPLPGPDVRPPAVAGSFYPADAAELSQWVDQMLGETPRRAERWPAVMVPHAGLRFSGRIAAHTLQQLEFPETIVILAPKHTRLGVPWAVAPHRTWAIPGATVASDPALAAELAASISGLQLDAAAHQQEHAIEVELPFLARLAPNSRVIGVTIGGGSLEQCGHFAAGLAAWMRRQTQPPLLMISSDMHHFASDAENRRLDELALAAMERLDPAHLFRTVHEHKISMCGVLPAVIVMETLRLLGRLKVCKRTGYATSADAGGDTNRVVGYAGMLLN